MGKFVDIWGVVVFEREGGPQMQAYYSRLADVLQFGALALAAFGAGVFGERLAALRELTSPNIAERS